MSRPTRALLMMAAIVLPLLIAADAGWKDDFNVSRENFSSTGRNAYFVLEPGYQMTFAGKDEGKTAGLVITVLDETKQIAGVETRIVEERETLDDKPIEVSRNFFAVDKTTNDIYYFGEDVDMYKDGKVTGHGGSWQAGKDGAKYGLFMPAEPKVGQRFYQEIAPKIAMDRVEITSVDERVNVPAGSFERCVKTEETTPLEPDTKEHKLYAPQVGLLIDGDLKLVKYGRKGE